MFVIMIYLMTKLVFMTDKYQSFSIRWIPLKAQFKCMKINYTKNLVSFTCLFTHANCVIDGIHCTGCPK